MIQAHKCSDGVFVVSENGVWIPGIYDGYESAKLAAANLSDADIVAFLEHIYGDEGEDRSVTVADVETTIAAVKSLDRKPYNPFEEK